MFSKLKINDKIRLLSIIALISLALTSTISYFLSRETINSMAKENLAAIAAKAYLSIKEAARTQKTATPQILELKDELRKEVIAKSGYIYVLDSKGTLIIHPQSEGKNIYDSQDAQGRYFIREILDKKNGSIIYPWKNANDTSAREKIAFFQHIPETNWIAAAGSYLDEFYLPLNLLLKNILLAALLTVLALFGASWWIYRNLNSIGKQTLEMCGIVFNSSKEISMGNQNMASRTEELASTLEEISSTIENITSNTKNTAGHVQEVSVLTQSAVTLATEGVSISSKTKSSMKEISESSRKISEIVKVVEDIAFQTNILKRHGPVSREKVLPLSLLK
ncbi:MAG: Cache 3/Cache 2 fusion domain-containing protein [Oligoflexia bacterium]|nr:Cache 3/Cache 2 fusion domain-containing protein [Oligoflexia bacterium]